MGVIENVLNNKTLNDLEVSKPEASPIPELTVEKVEQAISLLKEVEKNNGHIAIAGIVGLTQEQVREIHDKMLKKIEEIKIAELEELEV